MQFFSTIEVAFFKKTVSPEAPFIQKLLPIGIVSAKGIFKKVAADQDLYVHIEDQTLKTTVLPTDGAAQ